MAINALADVAEIIMGHSPPGSTVSAEGGVPLLNGPTDFGPSHPTPSQYTSDGRRFAEIGDLLFCVRGSTTGRMNWADQRYAIGRGIAAIRHRSDPTLQPLIRAALERQLPALLAQATGSTFANVSISQLSVLPWPDLDLQGQQSVARILGSLEEKIELNRRMSETLDDIVGVLYKAWFVDFDPVRQKADEQELSLFPPLTDLPPRRFFDSKLGSIPESWTVEPLSKMADHLRESEHPGSSANTRFSHYSIPAYDSDRMPAEQCGISIKSRKTVVKPGTVLVSRLNPEIERVWLADVAQDEPAVCSTEFLVLMPRHPFTTSYLYCLARSNVFRRRLVMLVTGTSKSHQRAPVKSVMSMDVLVPPASVIAAFDVIARTLLDRVLRLRREIVTLGQLRDVLLPKLISGDLRASLEDAST